MEAFGADINDRSRMIPGAKQRILVDGYQLPLDFINCLPYLRCRKPTDAELGSLPRIIMTSDIERDPSLYDNVIEDIEKFHDTKEDEYEHEAFNCYEEYRHRTVAKHSTLLEEEFFDTVECFDFDDLVDNLIDEVHPYFFVIFIAQMLAMLLQLSLTSSSYLLSLDGHLLIQSSKRLQSQHSLPVVAFPIL
jgi:hypothetical protein